MAAATYILWGGADAMIVSRDDGLGNAGIVVPAGAASVAKRVIC
jgi:hypothetical protein